jgi:histidinol-phosphate aminotransferase
VVSRVRPLGARPDLAGVARYVSPQRPARVRLNTNESPYPPPQELVDEVVEEVRSSALNRYPDDGATALLDALSGFMGWPAEGLAVANGSNEVFMHLLLAFGGPGRSAMTFEPTYSLHSLIPAIAGTRTHRLGRDESFEIDLDEALAAIRRHCPEMVIVCSPNNPTGGCEAVDTVRVLVEECPAIVVVDEAYGEFAEPEDSVRTLLDEHPNLVLVKTFSKAWRLAGARLGYMLADPALVSELGRVRLPYHLSVFTQAVGRAAIRHADDTAEVVTRITAERDRIAVELQAMGVKVFPSRANFVLFQVDDAECIWDRLLEREVLVRKDTGQPALQGCLRVTAGLPEETDAFLGAMEEALDG